MVNLKMGVKEFFVRMMDSKDPSVSSSVFLSVFTVLFVLYVWAIVCFVTSKMQDIPTGVWTFVGIVVIGKVGVSWINKPETNTILNNTQKTETIIK